MKNRYNRSYTYENVTFSLDYYTPTLEQCKYLMLKVIEYAVRDYCSLESADLPSEKEAYQLASNFLFDDNYRFMWGDWELSFEDMLDILDLNLDWTRKQIRRRSNGQRKEENSRPISSRD